MQRFLIGILVSISLSLNAAAADGDLDLTFNTNGFRTTNMTVGSDVIRDLLVQPDGKIVAGGSRNGSYFLIRYTSTGDLDTAFSGDGIVTTSFTGTGTAIALQGDKVLLAGTSAGNMISIVRYNSDGTIDTSWDSDGLVTTSFGGTNPVPNKLLVLSDQRVVVVGTRSSTDIFMARYLTDGSLDTTFNTTGTLIVDFGTAATETANDAALYPDGRIIIAGGRGDDGIGFLNFLVARFNSDGSFDTSFSGDGWVSTPVSVGNNDLADALALSINGRIVVGGIYNPGLPNQPCLVRYLNDGTLDTAFDGDGMLLGTTVRPTEIIAQTDGKFVTSGSAGSVSGIRKYNYDGSLDTSFSLDGHVTNGNLLAAMDIQADGKIVVGGQTPGAPDTSLHVARYENTPGVITAASSSVAGRVTAGGRGISRAFVNLVGADGKTSTVVTNTFGYFRFNEVESGQSYVLTVTSRQWSFAAQVINVDDNITGLEIVGTRKGITSKYKKGRQA